MVSASLPPRRVLYLVFFLSGASALAFETLWFRLAGQMLGNNVWASSVVLAGFMGGLAIGNALSARYGACDSNRVPGRAGTALLALGPPASPTVPEKVLLTYSIATRPPPPPP